VRKVDHDQAGASGHRATQRIDVERPALRVERHRCDVGSRRACQLVQRLIGRYDDHRMITRRQQRVHRDEDAFFGPGEGQHVVRRDRVVQTGDLRPQKRQARRLRVSERELLPEASCLVIGQREQLVHPPPLDVGCAQHMTHRELPAGEIALERELGKTLQAHVSSGIPVLRRHERCRER
jgi:hypothetical protein